MVEDCGDGGEKVATVCVTRAWRELLNAGNDTENPIDLALSQVGIARNSGDVGVYLDSELFCVGSELGPRAGYFGAL
jgi:hypothetical protein